MKKFLKLFFQISVATAGAIIFFLALLIGFIYIAVQAGFIQALVAFALFISFAITSLIHWSENP